MSPISSETARRTAAKFCTRTRAVYGQDLYVDGGHRCEENEHLKTLIYAVQ